MRPNIAKGQAIGLGVVSDSAKLKFRPSFRAKGLQNKVRRVWVASFEGILLLVVLRGIQKDTSLVQSFF